MQVHQRHQASQGLLKEGERYVGRCVLPASGGFARGVVVVVLVGGVLEGGKK